MRPAELRALSAAARALWDAAPGHLPAQERTALILRAVVANDTALADPGEHAWATVTWPASGGLANPGPERWSGLLQALLDIPGHSGPARRRGLGAFYTPPALVELLIDLALQPLIDNALASAEPARALKELQVLDPSCGAGAFLCAAARRLAAAWTRLAAPDPWGLAAAALWGWDIEPAALAVCQASLAWLGGHGVHLHLGDFLAQQGPERWSCIVGNPPFLGQLKGDTVRGRDSHRALGQLLPGLIGAYTDTSAVFLAVCAGRLAQNGRLALVQPLSLLASRDAAAIRDHVQSLAELRGLWIGQAVDFGGARVDVCAPILDRAAAPHRLQVHVGLEPVRTLTGPPRLGASWSAALALALGTPTCQLPQATRIGDMAAVTGDFRDQFYGLVPFVREAVSGEPGASTPPLVLTGHVDPLQSRWGQAPVRFAKQRFQRPVVDLQALVRQDPKLGVWARGRLVPKLVMATQSKLLEVAVDEQGSWLNTTPTLTIVPLPEHLWRVAAALCSATLTAWAWQQCAGSAITASVLKLSARQVAALPLPSVVAPWDKAAAILQQAATADQDTRMSAMREASRQMALAYLGHIDEAVEAFWWARLAK